MGKIQKNQKVCIFCAERGVNSKEHFFPSWLPEEIKKWDTDDYHVIRTTDDMNNGSKVRQTKRINGIVATRKIRCVCMSCNSGWMSIAEKTVRPFLEPLIAGEVRPLSKAAAHALSHWIALKVVVSEYSDQKTIVTPQDMRASIMHGKVPDAFNIYIGSHIAQDLGFCRTSHTVELTRAEMPPYPHGTLPKNTQQVTFTVGRFFAHVNMTTVKEVDLEKVSGFIGFYNLSKI